MKGFLRKVFFPYSSEFDYLCVLDFEAQFSNDEKLEVQVFSIHLLTGNYRVPSSRC